MMDSAISILHNIRKDYEAREKYNKMMVVVFGNILLIDIIIMIYTHFKGYSNINGFAQTGLTVLSALLVFSVFIYYKARKDINNLDEFYLEGEFDAKRQA